MVAVRNAGGGYRLDLEQWQAPVEAGIVDKVEFFDGVVRMDEHQLAWAPSQIAAAAELGITPRGPESPS